MLVGISGKLRGKAEQAERVSEISVGEKDTSAKQFFLQSGKAEKDTKSSSKEPKREQKCVHGHLLPNGPVRALKGAKDQK